jgi:hypothetical protein
MLTIFYFILKKIYTPKVSIIFPINTVFFIGELRGATQVNRNAPLKRCHWCVTKRKKGNQPPFCALSLLKGVNPHGLSRLLNPGTPQRERAFCYNVIKHRCTGNGASPIAAGSLASVIPTPHFYEDRLPWETSDTGFLLLQE